MGTRTAKASLARYQRQIDEAEDRLQRLRSDAARKRIEADNAPSEFKRKQAERAVERLDGEIEQAEREIRRLTDVLPEAEAVLTAAKARAPQDRKTRAQLETLLRELAAEGMSIIESVDDLSDKLSRLQKGREEIRQLRMKLGLGRAENWLPFEAGAAETVIANIWWLLADRKLLPSSVRPERPPAQTLAQLFSDASLRAYLPPDDDDDDSQLPPAA